MNKQRSLKKMIGASMIEVLVTMVILAIGLLGIAALQLNGLRSANNSAHRTQATLLADDMAERMRANAVAVDNNIFAAVDSAALNCGVVPAPYCGESYDGTDILDAGSCNATELAVYDINVWFCGNRNSGARYGGVQNTLPQAVATITCTDIDPPTGVDPDDCTNRSSYHTVTVGWVELNPDRSAGAAATVNQSISISVQQ